MPKIIFWGWYMKTFKYDLEPTTNIICINIMHILAINATSNHTTHTVLSCTLMKIITTFSNITTIIVENNVISIMRMDIITMIMNKY